jgi:hypothetical protein
VQPLKDIQTRLYELDKRVSAVEQHVGKRIVAAERSISERFGAAELNIAEQVAAMRQNISERIEAAEQSIDKHIHTIEQNHGKCVGAIEQNIVERIEASEQSIVEHVGVAEQTKQKIWKQWLKTFDSRIWKAEQNGIQATERYGKSIRSDIFNVYFDLQNSGILVNTTSCKNVVYNNFFYKNNRYGSVLSAQNIFFQLLRRLSINIRSAVDFGCGVGTWLYAAKEFGITEILGLDGDYVERAQLMISGDEFVGTDLEKPVVLNKKYDMAMSLECAEHLREKAANVFVDSLCGASDVILFSAAHPGQMGDHHINEQPIEYWRGKFLERGYSYIEIRNLFQSNPDIETWYKENISLYAKDASIYRQ